MFFNLWNAKLFWNLYYVHVNFAQWNVVINVSNIPGVQKNYSLQCVTVDKVRADFELQNFSLNFLLRLVTFQISSDFVEILFGFQEWLTPSKMTIFEVETYSESWYFCASYKTFGQLFVFSHIHIFQKTTRTKNNIHIIIPHTPLHELKASKRQLCDYYKQSLQILKIERSWTSCFKIPESFFSRDLERRPLITSKNFFKSISFPSD